MNLKASEEVSPEIPGVSFRDRIATVDASGKRKWVYAQQPAGRFYTWRTMMSWIFFILFFTLPFIRVDEHPLFLLDVVHARFILFGKIFWPQDFFIFGLTMVTFIIFVVLFTAAFGRLFCGWVCPQTIFMEMFFRKIEFLIQGSAASQKLLNSRPWDADKIVKKTAKHLTFLICSFIIGNTFLSYFIGITELKEIVTSPPGKHLAGFMSMSVFTLVFYGVYAFFREQVCTVVCPYGRLQGVLLDRNSMVVAYDYKRGEPRSKFSKKIEVPHGDCIDCFQCVKVCPTGIDIRNGTQMECIGCTACIDACDNIMKKTKRPPGLIRYASENAILHNEPLRYSGRMKFYTGIIACLLTILSFLLMTRKDIDATIIRTPGMLYQQRPGDSVSNLYNIRVANKTNSDIPLTLKLENMAGIVETVGGGLSLNIKKEEEGGGSFFVVLPASELYTNKTKLEIGVYHAGKQVDVINTTFMSPGYTFIDK
ncbi:cytochrome c oxidase accessory protein CcoG [Flavitalea antarctica]